MCGQCRGTGELPDWYFSVLGDDLRAVRLARSELTAAARRILAGTGIDVVNPPGTAVMDVRDAKGRHAPSATIAELLDACEMLSGRSVDPLEPKVGPRD